MLQAESKEGQRPEAKKGPAVWKNCKEASVAGAYWTIGRETGQIGRDLWVLVSMGILFEVAW